MERNPATEQVLSDLVAVRAHGGITILRVKEHATYLQRLRATQDEISTRNLAADDVHAAAFHVVKCAVSNAIERTDHREILTATLNLNAAAENLTGRRLTVRNRLVMSAKEFQRVEQESYMQLAGELVMMISTPCPFEDSKGAFAAHTAKLGITVTFNDVDEIVRLLAMIDLENRTLIRERLALRVLSLLPNGAGPALAGTDSLSTSLNRLVWAAASNLEDQDETAQSEVVKLAVRINGKRTMDDVRYRFKPSNRASFERQREEAGRPRVTVPVNLSVIEVRRRALESLAHTMNAIERADLWRSLLQSNGDHDRLES